MGYPAPLPVTSLFVPGPGLGLTCWSPCAAQELEPAPLRMLRSSAPGPGRAGRAVWPLSLPSVELWGPREAEALHQWPENWQDVNNLAKTSDIDNFQSE